MTDALGAWKSLSEVERSAFEQAWGSWRAGSLGVGAAIADESGFVIALGQNQLNHDGSGPISRTWLAHAEMNALATLPPEQGHRYSLFSTLQPCHMCTAAIHTYRVAEIRYAAADPNWSALGTWLQVSPWESMHELEGTAVGGEMGAFGYLLHVSRLRDFAVDRVMAAHRDHTLAEVITDSSFMARLEAVASCGSESSAFDALEAVWKYL